MSMALVAFGSLTCSSQVREPPSRLRLGLTVPCLSGVHHIVIRRPEASDRRKLTALVHAAAVCEQIKE